MRVDGPFSAASVPGYPAMVLFAAARLRQTAEVIATAARALRQLDSEGAQSDAIDAFLDRSGTVAEQLEAAHARYAGAGEALHAYAVALRQAQEEAGPAAREHEAAVADRDAAAKLAEKYEGMALVATSEEAQRDYDELARVQRLREDEAGGRVVTQGRKVDAAVAALDVAAEAAIARFDDVTSDGLVDSWWDDVRGVASAAYESFQQWMEENDAWIQLLTEALGYIGLALMLASFLCPFTAWIGVVATATMLASTATEAARAAAGTGSLMELGISIVSLATFGVGGAALKAAAKTSVAKVAFERVAELQRGGVPLRTAVKAVNGEHRAIMDGPLDLRGRMRGLGDPELGRLSTWSIESTAALARAGAETVARLDRLLVAGTALRAASAGVTAARVVDASTGWLDPLLGDLRDATTLRIENGTAW